MSKKHVPAISQVAEHPCEGKVNFSEQSSWLLGYFSPGQLIREPHLVWYLKGYNGYKGNSAAIDELNALSKEGLKIGRASCRERV